MNREKRFAQTTIILNEKSRHRTRDIFTLPRLSSLISRHSLSRALHLPILPHETRARDRARSCEPRTKPISQRSGSSPSSAATCKISGESASKEMEKIASYWMTRNTARLTEEEKTKECRLLSLLMFVMLYIFVQS